MFTVRFWVPLLVLVVGTGLMAGCGGAESEQETAEQTTAQPDTAAETSAPTAEEKEPVKGLSIYPGAPVRKSPGGDGDYVTGLSVGETLTFLHETEEAERGGDMSEYSRIRLVGGDEGWVRSDMIATDAEPAAILRKATLHERPTAMATTDENFQAMDVVAVLEKKGSWMKVRGMRRGERWWDEGWVRPAVVSTDETDVAVAALWKKAREEEDASKRRKKLKRITANPSFEGSVFLDSLRARLDTTDEG